MDAYTSLRSVPWQYTSFPQMLTQKLSEWEYQCQKEQKKTLQVKMTLIAAVRETAKESEQLFSLVSKAYPVWKSSDRIPLQIPKQNIRSTGNILTYSFSSLLDQNKRAIFTAGCNVHIEELGNTFLLWHHIQLESPGRNSHATKITPCIQVNA